MNPIPTDLIPLLAVTSAGTGVQVLQWLTGLFKGWLELRVSKTAPAHDTIIQTFSAVLGVLMAEVATFAVGPAVVPGIAHQNLYAAIVAFVIGLGLTFGSAGSYKSLTAGKVDDPSTLPTKTLPPAVGETPSLPGPGNATPQP